MPNFFYNLYKKAQNQPEHIRFYLLIISVIACMAIIVSFWAMTLNQRFVSVGDSLATTTKSLSEIPSLVSTLKENFSNIMKAFSNRNQTSTATGTADISDRALPAQLPLSE